MKIRAKLGGCHAAVMIVLALAGCKGQDQDMSMPPPPVSALTLTAQKLELTEDLPGRVSPVRIAEIRPQVSGIVERRLFEQGAEVKVGQALYQINAAPFTADANSADAALRRARATLERAQIQADRVKPLFEADAVSKQVYDDAVSQHQVAVADVEQAKAALARRKLDVRFATVEAPISGRIDQAMVTEGALVGTTDAQPMARIQQIDQVYVNVRRPASSLASFRQAMNSQKTSGSVAAKVILDDGSEHDRSGQILFSGITVDSGTGDVLLRVVVNNPDRTLLPGMFVRARVPRASYNNALTVPQQAVVRSGGKASVWTIDSKNLAQPKPVELGELIGGSYRVISGLKAGDKVVVEGIARVTEGSPVKAQAWESGAATPLAKTR